MSRSSSAETLTQRIQQLLEQRQAHTDAIAQIDSILERASAALSNGAIHRGRPTAARSAATAGVTSSTKRPGRRRGRFATSAEESIFFFITEHKNPTTQAIKKHWADEGRGGTADNTLSKLVKEKKLKRTPLEGQRGSQYALA